LLDDERYARLIIEPFSITDPALRSPQPQTTFYHDGYL